MLPLKKINLQKDTKTEAYFYFRNCLIKTSANGITVHGYDLLAGEKVYIWERQIRPYDFTLLDISAPPGVFEQFCSRTIEGHVHNFESLKTLFGYLVHRYWIPSNPVIPIFLDQDIDPMQSNGRNGKTMYFRALSFVRETVIVDGKSFNPYDRFTYQEVEHFTELIFIDDLNRKTSFDFAYSIVSTGLRVEKKGQQKFMIPIENMPKIGITTNHILRAPLGTSTEGRKIEFEVSHYYSLKRRPVDEFHHNLFSDWDGVEFNRMFNFILQCSVLYFKRGIILPESKNTELRKLLAEVGEDIISFLDDKVQEGKNKYSIKDTHDEFLKSHRSLQNFNRSASKFGVKMLRYFEYRNLKVIKQGPPVIEVELSKTASSVEEKEAKAEPEEKVISDVTNTPHSYHTVETGEDRHKLMRLLAASHEFAFDTKTEGEEPEGGLDIHTLHIVGISFSVKPHEAFYVPLPTQHEAAKEILKEFEPVFADTGIVKVGHNLKFDIQVLRRYDIPVNGELFDTMVAHYLLAPKEKHGLKQLSLSLLHYKQLSFEGLTETKGTLLSDVPIQKVSDYAAEDANMTYRLKLLLAPQLIDKNLSGLYKDIERRLVPVLADMQYTGIKVDAEILESINSQADIELADTKRQVYELTGKEFNMRSPEQVSQILFDEFAIEPIGEKGKSGNYSTGKRALKLSQGSHPVIPLLLKYKETASIKSNFLSKLPGFINPKTARVHTSFNQVVAATGRLSSSEPNLQNIPKKADGIGSVIRSAFIPKDDNHLLIASDYSQVELRVMAHYSKDPALVEAFRNGIDPHTVTAGKVFGVPIEIVSKQQRKIAKSINFGLNYGMSAKGLAEQLTAEGIATSLAEANDYIAAYFDQFKGVKQFQEDAYYQALQNGYAETLFGRKRYLPEINSSDSTKRKAAKRRAINLPIQGTAADIIKIAMVRVHEQLLSAGMETRMLLSVHDELVFESPVAEVEKAMALIKSVMEGAAELIVPLEVDIKTGKNWLEAH